MANSQDLDSCFRDFENGSWGFFVNDLQGEEEYGSETEVQADVLLIVLCAQK